MASFGVDGLNKPLQLSIATWNTLADAYIHGISKSKELFETLRWERRKEQIEYVIRDRRYSFLCLQEVDHFNDFWEPLLSELGYSYRFLSRPTRLDGCLTAWRDDETFSLAEVHEVLYDDLASAPEWVITCLGLDCSERLIKNNVALCCVFTVHPSGFCETRRMCVSNTHLHWNPAVPRVKLAQIHYLLERIADIGADVSILTGDLNSFPHSEVVQFVEKGPLTAHGAVSMPEKGEGGEKTGSSLAKDGVEQAQACLERVFAGVQARTSWTGHVKFLCDASLSRLARWLRLLGVDASLEASMHAKDLSGLFARARADHRVILTTSTSVMARGSRPTSYLVSTMGGQSSLEASLVDICRRFKVTVARSTLLSVCGKCGGAIESAKAGDARFQGKKLPLDRPLYLCSLCHQPYYFNDNPRSSPARAMRKAQHLLALVEGRRAPGTWVESEDGEDQAESTVASEAPTAGGRDEAGAEEVKQREKAATTGAVVESESVTADVAGMTIRSDVDAGGGDDGQHQELSAFFKERDAAMADREQKLQGSGADGDVHGSSNDSVKDMLRQMMYTSAVRPYPSYTNKNQGFRGCLDYIFVRGDVRVVSSRVIEHRDGTTQEKDRNFPNDHWPSDHMLVEAFIEL